MFAYYSLLNKGNKLQKVCCCCCCKLNSCWAGCLLFVVAWDFDGVVCGRMAGWRDVWLAIWGMGRGWCVITGQESPVEMSVGSVPVCQCAIVPVCQCVSVGSVAVPRIAWRETISRQIWMLVCRNSAALIEHPAGETGWKLCSNRRPDFPRDRNFSFSAGDDSSH